MNEKLPYRYDAASDIGCQRKNNEDNCGFHVSETHDVLMFVADGMGGHNSGEVASAIAAEFMSQAASRLAEMMKRDNFEEHAHDEEILTLLEDSVQQANDAIIERGSEDENCHNMGTTLTAMVIHNGKAYFGHVGDSRAYLVRKGRLRQLTNDHSFVAEQLRLGLISRQEAEDSPHKNVLTRALGVTDIVKVDLFREQLCDGDLLLLCSDGLTNPVTDEEILDIVLDSGDPSSCCGNLIARALENGAPDNVSVAVFNMLSLTLLQRLVRWIKIKVMG
ncbi:MAG: serine/threonine protein phosphatase [Candidatus Wallbacteria bacterium HGW-Wallbacteria-1]|jgi:protein phosphatase|uniref:Serine/threonine protein phosphatase n=1 Tax=Candidatus Wallbacteria bacterium HGW-Wallbacteria-1 TaxID=2013854 RepID=A0A2N1PSM1_9BACT|nr:MAG: serine/threonine protein phosphatase [Candidatus Wallbacteria bacterium HGW-Wallbacteria-1]